MSSVQEKKKGDERIPTEFIAITAANVKQLKALNLAIFPVRYSDKFYRDVLQEENKELVKLAYHNASLIGAICCRYEADTNVKQMRRIYIMTLGVLAPYRGYGIGSKLLQTIISHAEGIKDISDVYLHVQISNEEAINFYKKSGFEISGKIEKYYHRIDPPDCFILSKKLHKPPKK